MDNLNLILMDNLNLILIVLWCNFEEKFEEIDITSLI